MAPPGARRHHGDSRAGRPVLAAAALAWPRLGRHSFLLLAMPCRTTEDGSPGTAKQSRAKSAWAGLQPSGRFNSPEERRVGPSCILHSLGGGGGGAGAGAEAPSLPQAGAGWLARSLAPPLHPTPPHRRTQPPLPQGSHRRTLPLPRRPPAPGDKIFLSPARSLTARRPLLAHGDRTGSPAPRASFGLPSLGAGSPGWGRAPGALRAAPRSPPSLPPSFPPGSLRRPSACGLRPPPPPR